MSELAASGDVWLRANAVERMDALRPDLFETTRTAFHLDRYRFACRYARGAAVADVACGTGYGSVTLRRVGRAALTLGYDINLEAVAYAKSTYHGSGLRFAVAAAHRLPLEDNVLDLVTSFETIEHIAEEREALEEWARVLRPGGLLIVSTPNAWGLEKAPFHVRDYTADTLARALQERFEIRERWIQNSGTPQRRENHGMSRGFRRETPENQSLGECLVYVASPNRS